MNIGYSCQLLTDDMEEVFLVDANDEAEIAVQLKDVKRRLDKAKREVKPKITHGIIYSRPSSEL